MLSIQQVSNHLPQISIEYKNKGCVAPFLLPTVYTELRAGTFTRFDKDVPFRVFNGDMGRLSEIQEIGESETNDNFSLTDWGAADAVPFDLASLTPTRVDRITRKVQVLTGQWNLALENKLFAAANNISAIAPPSGSWKLDTSNPIKDLKAMRQGLLMPPNFVLFDRPVWDRLQYHPNVLAIRSTFRPGSISKADLADILEVDQIIVADVKVNTANKLKTASYSYLWNNMVLMGYRSPEAELVEQDASWAALFKLESFGDLPDAQRTTSQIYSAQDRGTLVRLWEDPKRGVSGASMVAVSTAYQVKITGNDLAARYSGVLA